METVPVNPHPANQAAEDGLRRAPWALSPLVPAIAVALLTLLWLLSAFDGWAAAAFCSDRGLGDSCRAHVAAAVRPSVPVAVLAVVFAAAAFLSPLANRTAAAASTVRVRLLAAAAACWLLALAVLFVTAQVAAG